MNSPRRAGRPRAASREILEEAACELFLERGYEATSVADITARAGVSRSTFFNYVDAKSDLLWARFDEHVARLRRELSARRASAMHDDDAAAAVVASLRALAATLPPENVALAYAQAGAMGLGEELGSAEARRLAELRDVLAGHLRWAGADPLAAQVRATALAGALLAAVREWSLAGAGRPELSEVLERAFAALGAAGPH